MKTLTRYRVTALTLILAIVFSTTSPQAQYAATERAKEASTTDFGATLDNCSPILLQTVDQAVADEYRSLLLNSVQLDGFRDEILPPYSNELSLQLEDTFALSNNCYVGVYVPISGGAGRSFYSIWYDKSSRQPVTTIASLFTFDGQGNVAAKLYKDDQLQLDALVSTEGNVVSATDYTQGKADPLQTDDLAQTASSSFWPCMRDCLGEAAVPPWLIALVEVVCAVTCHVAPKWLCGMCVVIQVGVFGWTAFQCWKQCSGVSLVYLPIVASSGR